MKKTLLILLVSACLLSAQDMSNTQVHFKDTVITKSIDNNQKDIWTVLAVILPFIISLGGAIVAFYSVRIQTKLKKIDIKKELRTKQLDNFIDAYCELMKKYDELDAIISNVDISDTTEELKNSISKETDIVTQIKYYSHKMEMVLSERTNSQRKLLKLCNEILVFTIQSCRSETISGFTNEEKDKLTTELRERKDSFTLRCSAYVQVKRTEIENLPRKRFQILRIKSPDGGIGRRASFRS